MVGKAPKSPDASQTAAAQAQANKEAIAASQVNQVTPFGSLKFTGTVGQPGRTATQTLTPEGQQQLDIINRTGISQLGRVEETLGQPSPAFDEDFRGQQLENILARTQPQRDIRRGALETRLVNQGFNRGTQAFEDEFDQFNRAENDLFLAADARAGDETARQFQIEQATRQMPINELIALLSNTQTQTPNFINTGGPIPTDVIGPTFAAAAQDQASANATKQGLFGLGGVGLGLGGFALGKKFGFL